MTEIIPAILPADFAELEEKLSLISGLAPVVQIDLCDGRFVPSRTWPFRGDGGEWRSIITEGSGIPHWQDFDFEFDLMVFSAEAIISDLIRAGASRFFIHIESGADFKKVRELVGGKAELGAALGPDTPAERFPEFAEFVSAVQLMGIKKVGFQGQPFDERVIEKIAEIRGGYPHLPISVDGGVSLETAPALIRAGASRLVIGSALFESGDIKGTLKRFQNLSDEAS